MKQIIFLAALFLSLSASAQITIICKDSTFKVVKNVTTPVYDTSYEEVITGRWYDTSYKEKCNRWCQLGITEPKTVIDTIKEHPIYTTFPIYDTSYLSIIIITDSVGRWCDTIITNSTTEFGAKIQQDAVNDQLNVAGQLGIKWIRYGGEQMDTYTSLPNNLKRWVDEGYNVCVNIQATNTSGSNIVEYLHGNDTVLYKTNLRKFCQQFSAYIQGKGIKVVLAIENEPINTGYFTGPFANYIAQLKMSVPIAHEFGLPITDGAMHLALVEQVMANQLADQRAKNTKALLDAEKTNGVDFTNFHTSYNSNGGGFQFDDLVADVQWMRAYTGKPVMSNENGSKNIPLNQEKNYIAWIKQAKVVYSMRWSGDMVNGQTPSGGHATDALNTNTTLTDLGRTFRDEIKKP